MLWDYLRDCWHTLRLRATFRRRVHEQLLTWLDHQAALVPEEGGWWPLHDRSASPVLDRLRDEGRQQARRLILTNPYACNLLRLLEIYVAGPGLQISAAAAEQAPHQPDLQRACDRCWHQFLQANQAHFSLRETARRTWRDGECFLRLFAHPQQPPTVRYIDPEWIGGGTQPSQEDGIVTADDDIETITGYWLRDPTTRQLLELIPADQMLHLKYGVDSNQPRGITLFAPVLSALRGYERWLEVELHARKLQASIVLWRKVQGSPLQMMTAADQAASRGRGAGRGWLLERYLPGSIVTTSAGTELQFLQPHTNFGDAVPLGRLILLGIAAGAGLPEFMLTADASNANYASTRMAEGPAVKLFESEQQFFARALEPLWRWVLRQAAHRGELPADVLQRVVPHWTFPQLVNRDRARERQVDVQLVQSGILSRAEVARRDHVDPAIMQAELRNESAWLHTGTPSSSTA
ncbi:MAG: phage portal protein [Planctomycetaceae bacterium]|nr:MAG: phage portal protein [Planctomycetaceae bacterium]